MSTSRNTSSRKAQLARSKHKTRLKAPYRFSKSQLAIFFCLIVLVGGIIIWRVLAATSQTEVETWTASSASGVIVKADNNASGGQFAEFQTPTVSSTVTPTPTVAPPISADAGKSWALKFNEDFSSTQLDLTKLTPCFSWAWTYEGCSGSFNNGREWYQPSQIQIANGVAKLVAEPGAGLPQSKTYKSGLLSTTNKPGSLANTSSLYKFKYGYVEGRMKLPKTRGFFSAFWMMPPDYGSYNYAYEVDILETLGGTENTTFMTVHYNNRQSSYAINNGANNNGACPVHNYGDGYHTYGVNWQPSFIAYYIDGKECGRMTSTASRNIWNGDLEIILNLMVDVDWQKNWGIGLNDPTAKDSLDVDYIKVWQMQ